MLPWQLKTSLGTYFFFFFNGRLDSITCVLFTFNAVLWEKTIWLCEFSYKQPLILMEVLLEHKEANQQCWHFETKFRIWSFMNQSKFRLLIEEVDHIQSVKPNSCPIMSRSSPVDLCPALFWGIPAPPSDNYLTQVCPASKEQQWSMEKSGTSCCTCQAWWPLGTISALSTDENESYLNICGKKLENLCGEGHQHNQRFDLESLRHQCLEKVNKRHDKPNIRPLQTNKGSNVFFSSSKLM